MRHCTVAVLAAALVLGACGRGSSADSPEPSHDRDSDARYTRSDLRGALIRAHDIPQTHGDDFDLFELSEDGPSGDDVVSGSRECRDYLDRDFGAEPLQTVMSSYGDPSTTVTVTSIIDHYGSGEAADVMDEIRDLMRECDGFMLDIDGQTFEVATHLAELADEPDYDEVRGESLRVGLLVGVDGVPLRGTAYTIVREGDLIGTIGIEVPPDFGRDPSTELTVIMDENLRELVEGEAS